MKKTLAAILMLIAAVSIFADLVPRTKTITDSTLLHSIRNSCHPDAGHAGFSPIMRQYWSDYIGVDYDPIRELDERADRRNQFKTEVYTKEAFWGVIGHETDQHDAPDQTPEQILDLARLHLLENDPTQSPDYLSLSEVDAYMHNPAEDAFGRCLDLGYIFENTAFIVDMLWEHQDGAYQNQLAAKLDSLASYVDELMYALGEDGYDPNVSVWITEPQPGTWDNPGIYYHNGRIRLAGALGYAGCVLSNTAYHNVAQDYINHAKDELFTYQHSLASLTNPGYIGLHLTNSGVYGEGPAYTNYAFDGVTLFFTALKRQTGENLYDHHYMKQIFENSMNYIAPDFKAITQDDTYKQTSYTYELFIHYLYQSNDIDIEMMDKMEWYTNKYKEESISSTNKYPGTYNRYKYIFDYNPSRDITTYSNIVPAALSSGSTSDEELTVLRKKITNSSEYVNTPTLVVNHENSLALTHEDGDQSSFQLYYKGKQLLIDPGYGPASQYNIAKHWLESPYAHNLIMVNPDIDREKNSLNSDYYDILADANVDSIWAGDVSWPNWSGFNPKDWYEPVGDHGSITNAELLTPCNKRFFTINNDIQHLQCEIEYNHEQAHYEINGQSLNRDDEIQIERNYYMIDDSYFVIYDDVKSTDQNSQNVFSNQLHFASIPVNSSGQLDDSLDSLGVSKYRYKYRNDPVYLHVAMGSKTQPLSYKRRNNRPSGIYKTSHYEYRREHRDLRVFTDSTSDEQFLTVLIPSDSYSSPIEYTNKTTNEYLTKLHFDFTVPDIYVGIKENNIIYVPQEDIRFITESPFFFVETNSNFSLVSKFIINSGGVLTIQDMTGTRFDNLTVFDSDYDAKEVTAEWKDNELNITFKTEWNDHPKYKILRFDVEPENLHASSYFDTYLNGTQPGERYYFEHIKSLSYDDEYFYVNYDYSELASENLLTSELTIHQGVFDGITIQGVTQFGTGDIVLKNEIPVPIGAEIVFLPGSHPELSSDFNLVVDGDFTAAGTSENNIIFDKYSSTNWYKIEITDNGNANLKHCNFTNAQYPLNIEGYAIVDSCIFQNNDRGLFIDGPTGYQVKNSIITNCGYFGILIRDSHIAMYRSSIENNLITNNNYGLWFYNASTLIES